MKNNGSAKFELMAQLGPDGLDSQSLTAADFDQDGDLDLFVCAYRPVDGRRSGDFVFHDASTGGENYLFVRHDLGLLDASYEDKRDAGTPFQGRWAGEPRTLPLGPFVVELLETGAIDEASEYVQRNQSRFRKVTILDLVVRLGIAHLQAGNEQIAERHFQMARKIEPKTVGPEIERGKLLESRGEHRAAKAMYQAALIRNQSSPQALNNLAWLLATSPDEQVRNGNQALQFAMKASRLTGDRNPGILDTFAAALAEEQRWDEAIQVSTKAESLARQRRLFQLANEISGRIVLYKQRTPIHDAT